MAETSARPDFRFEDHASGPSRRLIGVVKNKAHQAPIGIVDRGDYQLAIVEFDDQGCCYDRRQIDAVAAKLASYGDEDAIIVVFVHGWKHNARSDDANFVDFQNVLIETFGQENKEAAGARPRPLFGVFVGWRGMSFYDRFGILDNLTFWGRQQAGRRVALGSVRELFGRFRHYRNHRKDAGGAPLLVIVGHSFGGMIVYTALAQSLIEAAAASTGEIAPRFADLVLLVNPAFEAARYLPIYELTRLRIEQKSLASEQPPVFISATAENDRATGWAFPLGSLSSLITESWLGRQERDAMLNTMGHLPWMTTHALSSPSGGESYRLAHVAEDAADNPFWVVRATPAVIDGHNGIFQPPFLRFVADQVFRHVQYSLLKASHPRS